MSESGISGGGTKSGVNISGGRPELKLVVAAGALVIRAVGNALGGLVIGSAFRAIEKAGVVCKIAVSMQSKRLQKYCYLFCYLLCLIAPVQIHILKKESLDQQIICV